MSDAAVTCERCGNAFAPDPLHPGFPGIHFCPGPADDRLWPDDYPPEVAEAVARRADPQGRVEDTLDWVIDRNSELAAAIKAFDDWFRAEPRDGVDESELYQQIKKLRAVLNEGLDL